MTTTVEMSTTMTTTTTNGADSFTHTGVANNLVALSFKLVRDLNKESLYEMMELILRNSNDDSKYANITDLFVLAFQTRDIRNGKGEKLLFYYMYIWLYQKFRDITLDLLELIPIYGSYKDLREIYAIVEKDTEVTDKSLNKEIVKLLSKQLILDRDTPKDKSISLAGKWAPREQSKHHSLAIALSSYLFSNKMGKSTENKGYNARKKYRKMLTDLNNRLNTIENLMCNGLWSDIDPGAVPAQNLKIRRKAFMNLDIKTGKQRYDIDDRVQCAKNFEEYMKQPNNKMHGENMQPHELVRPYITYSNKPIIEDPIIEAQFKSLCQQFTSKPDNFLAKMCVMLDTSGSMMSGRSKNVPPILPAIGLTALITRINHPVFRNFYIRFSYDAEMMRYADIGSEPSLYEIVSYMMKDGIISNTNFEKAYDLILKLCVDNNVLEEDLPEYLLVLSDMQFDAANSERTEFSPHYLIIQEKFIKAGYTKAPKILYWNLNGSTKDYPATSDTLGVEMVSGFSGNILKQFMEGKTKIAEITPITVTPYETLRRQLDSERYDPIRVKVNSLLG